MQMILISYDNLGLLLDSVRLELSLVVSASFVCLMQLKYSEVAVLRPLFILLVEGNPILSGVVFLP